MNIKLGLLLLICFACDIAFAQQQNIALHQEVTVSSEAAGHPAGNMVDGKISRSSTWKASSGKAPHIVELNFNKYYNISEIRIHSGITDQEKKPDEMTQAAGFWSVKNFKLQYWDDANWTDFPKAEVHENRLVAAGFSFIPAVTTFKIRLVCDDGEPISIMEIEAFGQVAANMPAPPSITSSVRKAPALSGSRDVRVKVSNKAIGKSLKFVGYNQGYYFPGTNVSGWMEYSNVNSVRLWASLNAFVPENSVQVDEGLNSVEAFDKRKNELRASPEQNNFIKWNELNPLYDLPDSSSTNAMVYNYALTELKRLGIAVILQAGSGDFKDNWANKWKQWQRYYALAYHSAKTGDVAMFAMQNEPNHRNAGPMKLSDWILGMQITSDAVHCAVADVNRKYGKKLEAKFVGPVTAGQNTDWWAAVSKAIRTDYHGKKVDKDLMEIFSTHSYNSPAIGYESRISNIRKIIQENHPQGQSLPIVYTEIGRWMNAYLIDKEETMDDPSLFTEWAGIYSNNMKNGGYGMWAFKFANTASGPYPRGIKSGHHYIWQGKRIVEDAYQNLAHQKPVKSSTGSNAKAVTDGDKSNGSVWLSNADGEKWLEIDLGTVKSLSSAVVYTGSAGGVYTAPDRIKNFKLQYLSNGSWLDIPGTAEKESRYAQVFSSFKQPVTTSKIRFTSTDKGILKVREIKVFAEGDGPSDKADFNVSGIQRTGEVVRLFAKGFKDERKLLETATSVADTDLDTYTSFDEQTGNYYMWLVQRGMFGYQLSVDLSALNVSAGTPVTAETVNALNYGEVSRMINLPASKTFDFELAPQSVVLLTIPSSKLIKSTLMPAGDASVAGGKKSSLNFGAGKQMTVQLDASAPDNNQVAYVQFNLAQNHPATAKRVIVGVSGIADNKEIPYRLHVYGIPDVKWDQGQLNWLNAPLLDKNEALLNGVGQKAFVAGELAFDGKEKYHRLDITEMVKKHVKGNLTLVFIRETRQLGDDGDKGRKVLISTREAVNKPVLEIWHQAAK
ncbi:discoidin domain-containing protein [Pedobacter heparinus]|uniref:discoidin domain-containing protein n=1 Tax=Pedobacter heparinus TaxID=984 RepID=UPI00292EE0E9|nr:discoidin domain-containing protein [Pedobacter heparinus]